jgi:hypothetical protein
MKRPSGASFRLDRYGREEGEARVAVLSRASERKPQRTRLLANALLRPTSYDTEAVRTTLESQEIGTTSRV